MAEQEKNAFQIKLASSDDDELRSLLTIKLNHIKDRMGASSASNFPSEVIVQQIREYSHTKMHLLNEEAVQVEARNILKVCNTFTKKIVNTASCTFPLVARTMSEIIHNCIRGYRNWNLDIVQLYLDDSLAGRLWVDSTENSMFVQMIQHSIECLRKSSTSKDKLGLYNRFSHCKEKLEDLIVQSILPKLQEPPSSMSLNHLLLTLLDLVILPQIRLSVSNCFENWLNNPAIIDNVKRLVTKLVDCIELRKRDKNTCDVDASDTIVVENVVKLRNLLMKTTAQMDLYKSILRAAVQKSHYLAKVVLKLLVEQDVIDGYSRSANVKLISSLYLIMPTDIASQVLGELMNEIINANIIKFTALNYSVCAKNILDELAKLCRTIGLKNIEIKIFLRELFPEEDHELLIARYLCQDLKLKNLYFALMGEASVLLQLLFSQEMVIEKEGSSNKDSSISSGLSSKKAVASSLFVNKSIKSANKLPSVTKNSSACDSGDVLLCRENIFLIQDVACAWISAICVKLYKNHNTSYNSHDFDSSWLEWVEKVTIFLRGIPSFSFEYDKIAMFNLKEVGGVNNSMLISLINMAATSAATSKSNMSLWLKLLEDIIQRAMQRYNFYEVNDTNIIYRLYSLTCLAVRTINCDKFTVDTNMFDMVGVHFYPPAKDIKPNSKGHKNSYRKLPPLLPSIADKSLYWKVNVLCYLLGCGSPGTIGKFLWRHVPNIKNLMLMSLSSRFSHTLSNMSQGTDLNDSLLFLHSQNAYAIYQSDCKGTLVVTKESVDPINDSALFEESIVELESKLHKYLFEPISDDLYLRSSAKLKRKLLYLEERRRDEEDRFERREREKNARAERAAARAGIKQIDIPVIEENIDEKMDVHIDDENLSNSEVKEFLYVVPDLTSDSPAPYITQFLDSRFGDDKDEGIVFLHLSGFPRCPPASVIQLLKKTDAFYNFGSGLRMCTDPDFIESTLLDSDDSDNNNSNHNFISREVIEKSKSWLLPTVAVDASILNRLPAVTRIHILSISSSSILNFLEKYQLWDADETTLLEQQDFSTNISLMCKLMLQLRLEVGNEVVADLSELMQHFFSDIHSYRREVRISSRMTLNTLLALLQLGTVGVEEVQTIIFRNLKFRKFYHCDYESLCNLLPSGIQNYLKASLLTSLYIEGDVLASFDILMSPLIPTISKISYFSMRPLQIGAMIGNEELYPKLQVLYVEIADHIIGSIQRRMEIKDVIALEIGKDDNDYIFFSPQKLYVAKNALRFMQHGYHFYVKLMSQEDSIMLEEGQENDLIEINIKSSLLEVIKVVNATLDVINIEDMEMLQSFKFSMNFTTYADCHQFITNLPINIVRKLFLNFHTEFTHTMTACVIKTLSNADCNPGQDNITPQESLQETFHRLMSRSNGKELEGLMHSSTIMSLFDSDITTAKYENKMQVPLPSAPITNPVNVEVDVPSFQRCDIDIELFFTNILVNLNEGLNLSQKLVLLLPFVSRTSAVNWNNLLQVLKTKKSSNIDDNDPIVIAFVYLTLKTLSSTSDMFFVSALDTLIEYLITLRITSSSLQQKINVAENPSLEAYFSGINNVQSLVDSTLLLLIVYVGNNTDLTMALTILRNNQLSYFKSEDLVVVDTNDDELDGTYLLRHLVYNVYLQFPLQVSEVFCSNDGDKHNFHGQMISHQRFLLNNSVDGDRCDECKPFKRRCGLKIAHPYSDALIATTLSQDNIGVSDHDASYCPIDHAFNLSLITLFNAFNAKIQNIKYLDFLDEIVSCTNLNDDIDTATRFILSVATEHPTIFMRHVNSILRELRVLIMKDKSAVNNSDVHNLSFDAELSNREHAEINVKYMNASESFHLCHVVNNCFDILAPYLDKHDIVTNEIKSIISSLL